MALVIDADGERGLRTTALPTTNSFSLTFWFYWIDSGQDWQGLFELPGGTDGSTWWKNVYFEVNRTAAGVGTFGCVVDNGLADDAHHYGSLNWASLAADTWYYICLASGASIKADMKAYGEASISLADVPCTQHGGAAQPMVYTATAMRLGSTVQLGEECRGRFAAFKMWDSALSSAQLEAERAYEAAQYRTGLLMETKLASDLLDTSGNGFDWTGEGTPSYAAGPTFGQASGSLAVRIRL